jgi:autoinducer 2 (AI-2) kinase
VPGRWVLESNTGPMGEALEWFARALYPDAAHPITHLGAEAATARVGAGGILSSLGVAVMNGRNMSVPMGSLTLAHLPSPNDPATRGHVGRAVLEGMAYGLRANAEQILAASGGKLAELRLTGGMSRSELWSQLVSDVLNVPVAVPTTPEASALGAAICAGVGAGVFKHLAEGSEALVQLAREHAPDEGRTRSYHQLYTGWQKVRQARAEADQLAAGMALQAIVTAPSPATAGTSAFRPRILVTADLDESGLAALRKLGDVEYASYREVMRLLTGPGLVKALERCRTCA